MRIVCSLRCAVCAIVLFAFVKIVPSAPADTAFAHSAEGAGCMLQLCYRSPQYLLTNYKRLRLFPRDIFISGVNLNHPVDCVAQPGPILFALRANSLNYAYSALAFFNQQYVAAQLAHAMVPYVTGLSASKSSLSCFGLNFEPVKLTTGQELTPASTIQELFTLCDVTGIAPISEDRDADLTALAKILQQLNTTCQ
jgi:hypothetical protein